MRAFWKDLGREDGFFVFYLVVAFFVFFYHLGLMPLLDDESTRALVSLEMVVSDNYVVPTTHGLLYQNKPPLFNWFIAGLMHLFPGFNELTLRLPSMLAILFTSVAIYLFFRKELNPKTALVVALAYLSCGRILFYDAMLGYIDPFFTLVLFFDVLLLYEFTKGRGVLWIFVGSYVLCLMAFLLKGLPAILFHGCTLFVALALSRKLKLLFSWMHLAGVFVFFGILTLYYISYSKQQDVAGLLATLWDQSSKRTVLEFTWWDSIVQILTFPFQFGMHFLPWTLLAFVLFKRRAWELIRNQPCLHFCAWVFVANIWVYWISPETRPRYLFIFLPLFFAVVVELFFRLTSPKTLRLVYMITITLSVACALAVLVPLFVPILWQMDLSLTICLATFLIILLLADMMRKRPTYNLALFALVLLCVRLVFNHFILPARKMEAPESEYKRVGVLIGNLTKNTSVHLLKHTSIDHDIAYYISSTNGKILGYDSIPIRKGMYVICSEEGLKREQLHPELEFHTNFNNAKLFLARKQ
jgi:4-amino-4-deoxy-L-arabinose transferase-like glycosyltransferase